MKEKLIFHGVAVDKHITKNSVLGTILDMPIMGG